MQRRIVWAAALVAVLLSPLGLTAQDVRYYQDPNSGVTYKETNHTIQRQIPSTQYQPSSRTVLRGQYRTDTQGVVRTYSVPVTEYRTETYWQGQLQPLYAADARHTHGSLHALGDAQRCRTGASHALRDRAHDGNGSRAGDNLAQCAGSGHESRGGGPAATGRIVVRRCQRADG